MLARSLFVVTLLFSHPFSFASQSPYQVNPFVSLPVTLASLGLSQLPPLFSGAETLTAPPCGSCDISQINSLDRGVTSLYSKTAAKISDVGLLTSVTYPFTIGLIDTITDSNSDGSEGWAKDTLVITQAMSVTALAIQIVKYSAKRPRPFTYNPDVPLNEKLEPDAELSFFSGHTALAFCAAVAVSRTFALRHPSDSARHWVWAFTLGIASATGINRILAGKHFVSDVAVGAAVGTLIAYSMTELEKNTESSASPQISTGQLPPHLEITFLF